MSFTCVVCEDTPSTSSYQLSNASPEEVIPHSLSSTFPQTPTSHRSPPGTSLRSNTCTLLSTPFSQKVILTRVILPSPIPTPTRPKKKHSPPTSPLPHPCQSLILTLSSSSPAPRHMRAQRASPGVGAYPAPVGKAIHCAQRRGTWGGEESMLDAGRGRGLQRSCRRRGIWNVSWEGVAAGMESSGVRLRWVGWDGGGRAMICGCAKGRGRWQMRACVDWGFTSWWLSMRCASSHHAVSRTRSILE